MEQRFDTTTSLLDDAVSGPFCSFMPLPFIKGITYHGLGFFDCYSFDSI
jgi:hypothetical protein